ncbi:MAG: alpha amylase C-terminal domain-containing protein, partial [Myxococcota bacterium]
MGWMHDTLEYMSHDPVHRKYHHSKLTFRGLYMYTENYVLSLSHDEVVHGKRSMLSKMPGDHWQKLANLRLLYGYMFGQPGKKLLFMGSEFGVHDEWNHDIGLDWALLDVPEHIGLHAWMRDLNRVYRDFGALHHGDVETGGFEWIHADDSDNSVLSFLRWGDDGSDPVVVVCNFTPVPRTTYRVGVPHAGSWREILNSDAERYGGSGHWMIDLAHTRDEPGHGHAQSLVLDLPPLGCVFLLPQR